MGPRLGSRGKQRRENPYLQHIPASMGPRLGSRGKASRSKAFPIEQAVLQWGRDLVVAEKKDRLVALAVVDVASMGPRLGSRGKYAGGAMRASLVRASMGPRLGSRGKTGYTHFWRMPQFASMGPRLGSRGKRISSMLKMFDAIQLQWGRDLVVAEKTSRAGLRLTCDSFNGAATW